MTTCEIVQNYIQTRNTLYMLQHQVTCGDLTIRCKLHEAEILLADRLAEIEASMDSEDQEKLTGSEVYTLCELATSDDIKALMASAGIDREARADELYQMVQSGEFAKLYSDDSGWAELSGPATARSYARQVADALPLYDLPLRRMVADKY